MSYNLIITGIITKQGTKTYTFRKNNKQILWEDIFNFISKKSIIPIEFYKVSNGKKFIEYSKIEPTNFVDIKKYSYYDMEGNETCNGLLVIKINNSLLLKKNHP